MAHPLYLKNVVTLNFDSEKCTGCGMCITVCPRSVFARSNGKVEVVERDACIECGGCQKNCPHGALTVRSGVGCAAAVINQMLGRKKVCCVIEDEGRGSSCC